MWSASIFFLLYALFIGVGTAGEDTNKHEKLHRTELVVPSTKVNKGIKKIKNTDNGKGEKEEVISNGKK